TSFHHIALPSLAFSCSLHDAPPTATYTLSLHDALPISATGTKLHVHPPKQPGEDRRGQPSRWRPRFRTRRRRPANSRPPLSHHTRRPRTRVGPVRRCSTKGLPTSKEGPVQGRAVVPSTCSTREPEELLTTRRRVVTR